MKKIDISLTKKTFCVFMMSLIISTSCSLVTDAPDSEENQSADSTSSNTITATQSDTLTNTITETETNSDTLTETQTTSDTATQTAEQTDTDTQTSTINESYVSIPLNSTIENVQPMTGIVFWTDNNSALSALGDIVQLEYSYLVYSDIINEAGIYNWDRLDELLDEVKARGHQIILRFRYTYPGETDISVPDYIANNSAYNLMYDDVEGANTFLPDWGFSGLETFTLQFFNDFSARYDGDPRIAMLQVGFGSYSEYHLYDGPLSLGTNFPSKTFQAAFLTNMDSAFKSTQWSISIDAASDEYSPFSQQDQLMDLEFGLFDDSFMHETHSKNDQEYNRESWLFFDEHRFEKNMMGGEFNYYSNYDQKNVLTLPDGPWGRNFESFSTQYNISYMIGNDQLEFQSAFRIEQASKATGYKFNVDTFEASDIKTRVIITNQGVAPIYYDAYPAVFGVRSSTSLKGLLPNQTREFIIETGGESPVLSIESDHLVTGQIIEFSADL